MYSVSPILDKRLERAQGSELDYTSNRAVAPRQFIRRGSMSLHLAQSHGGASGRLATISDMMPRQPVTVIKLSDHMRPHANCAASAARCAGGWDALVVKQTDRFRPRCTQDYGKESKCLYARDDLPLPGTIRGR
jgi:hypothetical protein